jgi:hypothetical protein
MLSKEECEQALMNICSSNSRIEDRKVFKDLINEHYELVEKHEMLENTYSMFCEDYLNPQPYKFEDLKEVVGKPIYDRKYKEFYILAEVKEEEVYKDEGIEKFMICSDKNGLIRVWYEENRFYPIHIAK